MENKIQIQAGDADIVERFDSKLKSKGWKTIIETNTPIGALKQLIEDINSGNIDTDNCFFRIVEGTMVTDL